MTLPSSIIWQEGLRNRSYWTDEYQAVFHCALAAGDRARVGCFDTRAHPRSIVEISDSRHLE